VTFRTPPDSVDVVHDGLALLWQDEPSVVDLDRMMFETALIELASNVIQHGSASTTIICRLHVSADDQELRAVLMDTADPPRIDAGPREMPDEMAESGRGLAFIHALVDSFAYERTEGGNTWTIARNRSAAE
jgi:serine/threonine-protein kinase RsbW